MATAVTWQKMLINNNPDDFYWRKELAGVVRLAEPNGDDEWRWMVRGPGRLGNGYLEEHARGEATTAAAAKKAADAVVVGGRSLASV